MIQCGDLLYVFLESVISFNPDNIVLFGRYLNALHAFDEILFGFVQSLQSIKLTSILTI